MSSASTLRRPAPVSRPAPKPAETAVQDPNKLVPFSTAIPFWVREVLELEAGSIGTAAAVGRVALTKYAEAKRHSL